MNCRLPMWQKLQSGSEACWPAFSRSIGLSRSWSATTVLNNLLEQLRESLDALWVIFSEILSFLEILSEIVELDGAARRSFIFGASFRRRFLPLAGIAISS